jgi:sulfocyanin
VPDTAQSPNPAAPATATAPVRVNEFLAYDAGARTATIQLVGGYNGLNGALNFNGGAKGSQTITVPLGWKVEASFVNRDGDLPHSAIVVREVSPIPLEAPPPAFPRAFTVKLEEGLQEGGTDDLSFVANKEGRFLIFCGVPGHGQGGMWIYLVVSPSASAPTYQ